MLYDMFIWDRKTLFGLSPSPPQDRRLQHHVCAFWTRTRTILAVPHKTKGIFIMGLWKVSPRLALVIRPFHTQKGNESWDHYTYAKDALNKMCLKACLHMTSYMSLKGASDYPAGKAYFGFPKCLLTSQVHTSEQPAVLTVLWIINTFQSHSFWPFSWNEWLPLRSSQNGLP